MEPSKILLTGATGYIGGSVLSKLLEKGYGSNHAISVLVRGENKAKVFESKGLHSILFNSLDDLDLLQEAASKHDIVIHTASGYHTASAVALIKGLSERQRTTGKEAHYIHTTGTSNLADQPITGKYREEHIFSDRENIYEYLKLREAEQVYSQRTTDIAAIETGLATSVRTHLIMSPTIYGVGTGLFNKLSIQIPTLIRSALKSGSAEVIGEGKGVWDYVHIADLSNLYELILSKCIAGDHVPQGEKGILFSATGSYSWYDLSWGVAKALCLVGASKRAEIKQISLEEAAEKWAGGLLLNVELGFASNSRTTSEVSKELGWTPEKTEEDFKQHFEVEARLIVDAERNQE